MVPQPALTPDHPSGDPIVWPPLADKPAVLPVVPREFHEFYRTPRLRWWKPLASILLFAAAWLVATMAAGIAAIFYDVSTGRLNPDAILGGEPVPTTPAIFTANNVALGVAVPLAGLVGWAVFAQRPRWLSSIAGGFRWPLFWRFAAIAAPIFLFSFAVELLLAGVPELDGNPDSAFLIVAILLTTPFQAAGEEYGIRGLLARSIGSWFGSRRAGFVVATAITSTVFALLHGAADPWLNGYYFLVGVACSVLVWRTGGLEAAVALHVCNNLIGEITLPFGGLDQLFERGAGTAGPEILIQLAFTAAVTVLMLRLARRQALPTTAAPAAQRFADVPPPPR